MYQAPDFVKVEMDQGSVFTSGCNAGTKLNNVDYTGGDLSGCTWQTIAGEVSYQCWYNSDEP